MLKWPSAGSILALAVVCATLIYAVIRSDPYVVLGIAPFFLLGCAKGKSPLGLLALASLPSLFLVFLSHVKVHMTGLPLSILDRHLLEANVLVLGANDYRVTIAIAVIGGGIVYYLWKLLSGRGPFTRFERASAIALTLAWSGLAVNVAASDLDFLLEEENKTPTVKTFVRSMIVPGAHLALGVDDDGDPYIATRSFSAPQSGAPDLLFVLQESAFDPRLVEPEYEPRALFARGEALSGPLKVHTFGGGTWLSEFSLVTQLRPQEFGDGGWYVFHQLSGRIKRSLFSQLKELGYRTVVVYPVPGFFLNARQFYTSIGVDEFYDPPALGLGAGWDWKLSDAQMFDAVLSKLDPADPRPVAALVLTIYQHGPHDSADPVGDYLARYRQSDLAYETLLSKLTARGRPTGLVTFGDHQPEFTKTIFADAELQQITRYEIRCVNFACDPGMTKRGAERQLDITLLTPTALEAFGFDLDDLSFYGKHLFDRCTSDIMLCADNLRLSFNRVFSAAFQ